VRTAGQSQELEAGDNGSPLQISLLVVVNDKTIWWATIAVVTGFARVHCACICMNMELGSLSVNAPLNRRELWLPS
jgi:hypothetical protein